MYYLSLSFVVVDRSFNIYNRKLSIRGKDCAAGMHISGWTRMICNHMQFYCTRAMHIVCANYAHVIFPIAKTAGWLHLYLKLCLGNPDIVNNGVIVHSDEYCTATTKTKQTLPILTFHEPHSNQQDTNTTKTTN